MCFLLIISPETAIGIAGGQLTVGAAHTLPSTSESGTTSLREKTASLTVITKHGVGISKENAAGAAYVFFAYYLA